MQRMMAMLSAFKNFFVTFLIAALIFGSGAYFAVQFGNLGLTFCNGLL